jgi:hypothetical protein
MRRPNSPAGLPSHAQAQALIERARALRAEFIAGLARAALSRLARRGAHSPAGARARHPAGALTHARA